MLGTYCNVRMTFVFVEFMNISNRFDNLNWLVVSGLFQNKKEKKEGVGGIGKGFEDDKKIYPPSSNTPD